MTEWESGYAEAVAAATEAVPRSWLDSLLTGPEAVIGRGPYTGSDIERLLLAVRARVAALAPASSAVGRAQEDGHGA